MEGVIREVGSSGPQHPCRCQCQRLAHQREVELLHLLLRPKEGEERDQRV